MEQGAAETQKVTETADATTAAIETSKTTKTSDASNASNAAESWGTEDAQAALYALAGASVSGTQGRQYGPNPASIHVSNADRRTSG